MLISNRVGEPLCVSLGQAQHGVNLAGAGLLTISLLYNLNPASLALEFFWAAIAIWGLAKAFRARNTKS